jgi:Ser/Thr protein kinase RdoA (MazF antagonist)
MSANISSQAAPKGNQLSSSAPDVSPVEAAEIAARFYGIHGTADLLTSERDSNFRLSASDGSVYLLKVSNPSEADEVVDLQTSCLEHIARADPARPVPRVLRTLSGTNGDHIVLGDGRRCAIRMLTYLDGVQAKRTPRTRDQRIQLGAELARLDLALRDFAHPAASHDLLWNVSRADRLAHLVDEITGDARRRIVRHFMDRFLEGVLPRLAHMRAQAIHNDFNLYNVLVAEDDPDRVTGVIDFGDLIHAPLVGEVATAAAFQTADVDDPLAAVAEFIGAYHAVLPLLPEEQEIVTDLVTSRHLITVLISEWRSRLYPENHAYIMRHNPGSWDALHLVADLSPQSARDRVLANIPNGDDR